MNELLIPMVSVLVAFIISYRLTQLWIVTAKKFGLVGKDINKYDKPEVAEAGGFSPILGLTIGLLVYLLLSAIADFPLHLVEIYATISALILAGFIGFSDDFLGWKKGIPQRYKPLLTYVIAIPFMTIVLMYPNYNTFSVMGIPLWVYAFIFVPLGIIGTSNAVNMLAGYNGLEAGLSIIILVTLAIKALLINNLWISYMALIAIFALIGFLFFNWYPAKVFPGDSLTYPIGAYIGALVILGNMEIFGICLLPLFFLDFMLYIRAKIIDDAGDVQAFGIPDAENHLEMPYSRIYDSCHLAILIQKKLRGFATERGVVITLYTFQIIISLITLIISIIIPGYL